MAIYHCSIKIISRGKGKSAVAAAAYRAGQTITNEYDGITHDYTRKRGIVHTEILLPQNAPSGYSDRAVLWNAVEQIEKARNSQLAREVQIAIPVELTREQSIPLVREYVKEHFVKAGMCADIAIHDTGSGNPHAHIMLTMRPFEQNGEWGDKQKKVYHLEKDGNKIYDPIKRQYKCNKMQTTNWNERTRVEEWRAAWKDFANAALEKSGSDERIDNRSYKRQGIEKIPTVHLGPVATQMERKGIRTERGDMNRASAVTNREIRRLRARISRLSDWLKEEATSNETPTLSEIISNILDRQEWSGIARLKTASQVFNFLMENNITDLEGLERKVRSIYSETQTIRDELKPVERRLKTLEKHIEQGEHYLAFRKIYRQYKQQKPKSQERFHETFRREITLYEAAAKYLKENLNGHPLNLKMWKAQRDERTAEHQMLTQKYSRIKNETGKVEQIKRTIVDILRSDAPKRQQQQRSHDVSL